MKAFTHNWKMRAPKPGFTLVEIMIVVVIIGLLALLALPGFQRARMNTQNSKFMSEVRGFAGACETYLLSTGNYPADGDSGELPAGLDEYIKDSDFEVRSPLGGKWDVEVNDSGVTYAVGVIEITVDDDQLAMIDEQVDDGDITTGKFRTIRAGGYYMVLEE